MQSGPIQRLSSKGYQRDNWYGGTIAATVLRYYSSLMLKHSLSLATLDRELFPGVREEKDTRLWLLRKWAFAVILSVGLVYWSGALWQTSGGKEIKTLAGKASLQDAPRHPLLTGTQAAAYGKLQAANRKASPAAQAARHVKSKAAVSDAARAAVVIPKGTLIPVKIESTRLIGLGQTVILARTRSYVLPDKTVLIPAGSQVEGMAQRRAGRWEIHWHSVSVVSAGGGEAEIQAMNEIPAKASLYGRSLLVKAK